MGHEVKVCADGLEAVAALEKDNGIEVIAKAKEISPQTDSVVLTGNSSLETAIAALRYGAFDYLTKPCKLIELESLLQRVADKRNLRNQCLALQHRVQSLEGSSRLVGDSTVMSDVRKLISKVAPTNSLLS